MPTKPEDKIKYSEQEIANQSFDEELGIAMTESVGFDGQHAQRLNASNLSLLIDYVGGANPIYIGTAAPGTATSEDKWKITKLTYDGNNVTSLLYAAGTPNFDQVWDNRSSLSYS